MASFTTRVELHSAEWSDYDNLHKFMEQEGFSRFIVADDGKMYHLPTAEYNFMGEFAAAQVLAKAQNAASRTGHRHAVLVTEALVRTWSGLQEVARQPARR